MTIRLRFLSILPAILFLSCAQPPKFTTLTASARRSIRVGHDRFPNRLETAVAPNGERWIAWQGSATRLIHESGERWIPEPLPDSTMTVRRILFVDGALHVFGLDHGVVHWVRQDGKWRTLARIGEAWTSIMDFDVVADGNGFVVACVASVADDSVTPVRLVAAETREGSPVTYHNLAAFESPQMGSSGPRVTRWRDEIQLVSSLNFQGIAPGDSVKNRGQLIHCYRDAEGQWSVPSPIGNSTGYGDLALAATRDRLFLFYPGNGLQGAESPDGRRWSAPVRIPGSPFGNDPPMRRGLAASADSEHVLVTWCDTSIDASHFVLGMRKQGTDVFALMNETGPATLAGLVGSPIIRVTPKTGNAMNVATACDHGRRDVIWSDFEQIGVANLP